jgi:ABC-type bacteriocin/lantibiotic exporter with double-glycine peptidase domain
LKVEPEMKMEDLQPEIPEEPPKVALFDYPIAELGALVSGALGQSITPAEFRALEPIDQVYWTPDEFGSVMSDHGFVMQEGQLFEVLHPRQIKSLREIVLVALAKEKAWVMSFDESANIWKGIGIGDAGSFPSDLDSEFSDVGRWTLFKCSRRTAEHLAVVPGVEAHWFWSTIWSNRDLYLMSGLAALLTNTFALGVSMFSMIVYNRVIPSNAMDSLLVLVSGMLLLMIVDYVVRTVRNSFLSVAGVDSDLSLADKLFAQVLDLQYKSRNGTVGALANTLKEFEHIREFFASATLVSLIDVPFALIFLAATWSYQSSLAS